MKTIFTKFTTKDFLNKIGPGFYNIYAKNFSVINKLNSSPIQYTEIKKISDEDSESFISGLSKKLPFSRLDLEKPEIMCVKTADIELKPEDKFGQILFISKNCSEIKYGKKGIVASESVKPYDLLNQNLTIPPQSFGVLDIEKHVPFLIDVKNSKDAFALPICTLDKVYEHEENIKRYSLDVAYQLKPEDAKRFNLAIQDKIFHDGKNEYFYEEVTSKIYKPTKYNPSSGTLMNFENEELGVDKTTVMHYHPGERSLHIITTNKMSGVTLNFCGISENPDEKKDTEVHLEFPKNSMVVLNFPPYTHHKFHGEFVCMSVHPREGNNLIKAVESGTLTKGFLESATVFSKTKETEEKWELLLPVKSDNSNSHSRH